MAVLSNSNLTLIDWAKRTDPDGRIPVVAELLSQTNEILTDCVWKEGNLPTGERVVIRTGLPTVYWRSLNQGIPNSKSTTAQVDEACAILEARSEIDKDLAMLNGNTAQFRLSEDSAFLEAMNQKMAFTMFYGNPASDPKEFLGLASRYGSSGAGNAANILDSDGADAANNTSIYLVGWGDNTVYCPFPKGSKAGLIHEDLGEQTVYNGDNRMQALSTRYQWKCGLVVKDWRYVVRICDINHSHLDTLTSTQTTTDMQNVIYQMTRALHRIPNLSACRPVFYMHRKVFSGLSMLAMEKSNGVLAIQPGLTQFGTPQNYLSFLGVPIRKCDAIKLDEPLV